MKTFSCPSCSGPLEYTEAAGKVVQCRFCGQSVVVPDHWHGTPPRANATAKKKGLGIVISVVLLSLVITGIIISLSVKTEPDVSQGPTVAIPVPPARTPPLSQATAQPEGFRIVRAFGDEGTGSGRFEDGRALALDHQGHLYVAEYSGGRIQRFDTTGKFLSQWIANPDMPLPALVAGRNGIVYVVQAGNIDRYEGATGEKLASVPFSRNTRISDAFPLLDGGLLVVAGSGWSHQIIRLDAEGQARLSYEIEAVNVQVAADGLGYIYALAQYRERGNFDQAVFKYDPDGTFLNRFGSQGEDPGQFRAPHAITVDGQGRVYVSDINGLQVFDGDGRFLKTLKAGPSIFGMAFDEQDALYVMERNSNQVRKLRLLWP